MGYLKYKGEVIGTFCIQCDGDTVAYTINNHLHTLTFNAFETMCEALEYDVEVVI